MNKFVTWQQKLRPFVPAVLITVLVIGAFLTPQTWNPIVALFLAGIAISGWIMGLFLVLQSIKKAPDFQTRYGSLVWTNGLLISQKDVEYAQCHFLNKIILSGRITTAQVKKVYSDMRIEFTQDRIPHGTNRTANGLAYPTSNVIKVRWLNGFDRNAFFHEIMHVIQYQVWNYKDYYHKKEEDWQLVVDAKQTYNQEI